jgi:hypothetical protein
VTLGLTQTPQKLMSSLMDFLLKLLEEHWEQLVPLDQLVHLQFLQLGG